jgi:LysM repeat protein
MILRWKYSIFALVLILLAGCYRQADEQLQPITNPTSVPAVPDTSTATEPVQPTAESDFPATATLPPITVIQPQSTAVPQVTEPSLPAQTQAATDAVTDAEMLLTAPLPTAAVITPGGPGGLVAFDTPTPTVGTPATATPSGLVTPTTLFIEDSDECAYTVQPGDNLFRIAVNNSTTLEALRAANPDVVGDIIQPGQTLKIPDCVPDSTTSPDTADGSPAITSVPDTITVPDVETTVVGGGRIHTVQSGETLLAIARQYGVTIEDIVQANNLANPDTLSVGQELIIP